MIPWSIFRKNIRLLSLKLFGSKITQFFHKIFRFFKTILPKTKILRNSEDSLIDTIMDRIEKSTIVIDIGANTGLWLKKLAEKVGPVGEVHAFEPILDSFQFLKKKNNKLLNIRLYNIALSSTKSTTEMLVENDICYPSTAAIFSTADQLKDKSNFKTITVNTNTLDEIFSNTSTNRISFIKCDVEGHELQVMEGGENVIRKNKPLILLEILREKWRNGDPCQAEVSLFLKNLGYQIGQLIDGKIIFDSDLFFHKNENFIFIHSTHFHTSVS